MLTKNAINNMKNRYTAVLKKCRLMNVFGTLAVAGALAMAGAAPLAMPSEAMAAGSTTTIYVGDEWSSLYTIEGDYDSVNNTYTWNSNGNITITSTSDSQVYGVNAKDSSATIYLTLGSEHTIDISNTHDVPSDSDNAYAYGMYAEGTINTLTNEGSASIKVSMEVNSDGNYIDSRAYGIYAEGADNTLNNSGFINITTTATAEYNESLLQPYACGMHAYGDTNLLTNEDSGTITVSVTGTTSSGSFATMTVSVSSGMYGQGTDNTLTNYGSINTSAISTGIGWTYAGAIGMFARGDENFLTNSGSITASAIAEGDEDARANAYGMYMLMMMALQTP